MIYWADVLKLGDIASSATAFRRSDDWCFNAICSLGSSASPAAVLFAYYIVFYCCCSFKFLEIKLFCYLPAISSLFRLVSPISISAKSYFWTMFGSSLKFFSSIHLPEFYLAESSLYRALLCGLSVWILILYSSSFALIWILFRLLLCGVAPATPSPFIPPLVDWFSAN